MRIEDLKKALNVTDSIEVNTVIFDPMQELNIDRERDYPMVMWDLNTLKFETKPGRINETIFTIRAFVLSYYDGASKENQTTKEETWQQLHTDFLEYVDKVNENAYHNIKKDLNGEFYTEGTSDTESEIAIGYDVEITQSCL